MPAAEEHTQQHKQRQSHMPAAGEHTQQHKQSTQSYMPG
jgi:hypothetical protein